MIKTYKVMLIPNNKQKTKLFQCAGVARWAYNWALAQEQENHENGGKFLNDGELRKRLTQLKQTAEYSWLYQYSNNITKQAIKDAVRAYKNFFDGRAQFPKYKKKKSSHQGFYHDPVKLKVFENYVQLEKIGKIKLAETNRIPTDAKYQNPRVTFDGLNWWVSVGIEAEEVIHEDYTEGIGIDLGVKELATCSNGMVFHNINKSKKVKKLQKRLKRLQRQVSRKYEKGKEGNRYRKTNNIKKLEKLILKIHRRLKNIRTNYIHQITTILVKTKPEYVVMENLNTNGMLKNRHLSKAIQEQTFHEFKQIMEYKCALNGIRVILADRFYPSSKTCSHCGCVKQDLKLSDRVFICSECGYEIDRDLNASINLKKYGKSA